MERVRTRTTYTPHEHEIDSAKSVKAMMVDHTGGFCHGLDCRLALFRQATVFGAASTYLLGAAVMAG